MEHPKLTSPPFQFYDRYDATAYWCACTQRGFGPDREAVGPAPCSRDNRRACCE
jgi:hypothetical protein